MKYQKLSLVIVIALAAVLLFACDNPFWPEKTVKPEQEPEIPEVIADCGHNSYGEWLVTAHATCLTNGARERDCIACGHKQTEVTTDANAHNWEQSDGTPATCTEQGSGTRECTLCHEEEISDILEIDPTKHNWGVFTQTTLPTCTSVGIKTRDCTRCNERDIETEEGDPKTSSNNAHLLSGTTTVTVTATCVSAGANGRKCTRCAYFTHDSIINALGHSFASWAETTPATCLIAGLQTRACSRTDCTISEMQSLPALGHNWNGLWTKSGKLTKTCTHSPCTETQSLDDYMIQIQGGVMPIDDSSTLQNWGNYEITLSAFKMHKFEVTQDLYEAVMGTNPSNGHAGTTLQGERTEQRPVERVTWFDAVEFCIKLNEREELTGYAMTDRTPAAGYPITNATVTWMDDEHFNGYRLPTEAEWEYACRAGRTTVPSGVNYTNSAWFNEQYGRTHQVGLKLANPWGLYDIHGNVHEWCWDWYNASYNMKTGAKTNPKGSPSGDGNAYRITRGGDYASSASSIAPHYRGPAYNKNQINSVGFRIVLNQPQQQ